MPVENATKVSELVETNPLGSDPIGKGDDHIRLIKKVLKNDVLTNRLNPATLAVMIADNSIQLDDVLTLKDRKTGTGGGARWRSVLASSVTASVDAPGIGNIVLSTGGQSPALAFVLENVKFPGRTNIEEFINPRAWGAESTAVGPTSGFDNSPVTQLIVDHATTNASGMIHWQNGRFYFASVVNIPVVNDSVGTNGITFQGAARNATEFFTDQNIDMFTHQDNFAVLDMTIIQRGATGVTEHTGVAFRSNGQCRFCRFENLAIFRFKFGHLQRFSLWNYYKNVSWNGNLCGVKLARVSDMEDQTNPGAVGPWNRSDLDGWFHNKNTFDTCVFNGDQEADGGRGEIGFWGATEGCVFTAVTCQNYERDGTIPNQTIPLGQVSTGFEIVGGGPTSTNSKDNLINSIYFERTFKALKIVDQNALVINGLFTQGQTGGENLLEVTNSTVNITGQTNQSAGWFADIVAVDSNVTIDKPLQSSGGSSNRVLTNSFFSENVIPIPETIKTFAVTMAPEFGGTITIDTSADLIAVERQGNVVHFTGRLDALSVSSPTGTFMTVEGLPFQVGNATDRAANGSISVTMLLSGVATVLPAVILEGATAFRIHIDVTTLVGGEEFFVTGSYFTTAFS